MGHSNLWKRRGPQCTSMQVLQLELKKTILFKLEEFSSALKQYSLVPVTKERWDPCISQWLPLASRETLWYIACGPALLSNGSGFKTSAHASPRKMLLYVKQMNMSIFLRLENKAATKSNKMRQWLCWFIESYSVAIQEHMYGSPKLHMPFLSARSKYAKFLVLLPDYLWRCAIRVCLPSTQRSYYSGQDQDPSNETIVAHQRIGPTIIR